MSELMSPVANRTDFRWKLLTTVSTFALIATIYGPSKAKAADSDRPTMWIELGGQLERVEGVGTVPTPPFLLKPAPSFETLTPLEAERRPRYSVGGEGKISFEPKGTNWVFSASIRYGRSNGDKHAHNQTVRAPSHVVGGTLTETIAKFADTKAKHDENHAVADFQAGKDVGLGMFGSESISTISVGVRFVQFAFKTALLNIKERPDVQVYNAITFLPSKFFPATRFHDYALSETSARSFRGVGPSISWNASAPFAGNRENAEFAFDWGMNAAVLFGRQRASVQHQTTARYFVPKYHNGFPAGYNVLYQHAGVRNSAHSVVIPNVGGFAGVSVNFPNARVNLGFRGDFFFGAMDGGIDARRSVTPGFYGPFASISIGLP